jgi:hypothetical protein
MTEVIGGIGTSHSLMLLNDPETWRERADQDTTNQEFYDNDGVVTPLWSAPRPGR